MKPFLKKISLGTSGLVLVNACYAAPHSLPAESDAFKPDGNLVLAGFAFLLLAVIFVLGYTLRSALFFYDQKKKKATGKKNISGPGIVSIILFIILLSASPAMALDTGGFSDNTIPDAVVIRWILYCVLGIELTVIFLFAQMIRFFTGAGQSQKGIGKTVAKQFNVRSLWIRMNRLKPMEEEMTLDTGHSYDGIRELNNVTPPWFIAGFMLSILCAGAYLWRYHVAASAPLQIEEYDIAVAEAKIRQDEFLKNQANKVDENTVVMLGTDGITAGQALFTSNCVACHGDRGQGASVGPNLTDNYWLHSGGIKDIFKSIKYGWQEKGMKSWKDDFSPTQIAQLASYIYSLKGSNPAGAKEAQGDLFTEPEERHSPQDSTAIPDAGSAMK